MAVGSPSCVQSAMLAPHVAALIRCVETLATGDVNIRIQLPPVLTPLRQILDRILQGTPGDNVMWARLVRCPVTSCRCSGPTCREVDSILVQFPEMNGRRSPGGLENATKRLETETPRVSSPWGRAVRRPRSATDERGTAPFRCPSKSPPPPCPCSPCSRP